MPLYAIGNDRGIVAENLGYTLHHFGGIVLDPDHRGRAKLVGVLQHHREKDIVCGEQMTG